MRINPVLIGLLGGFVCIFKSYAIDENLIQSKNKKPQSWLHQDWIDNTIAPQDNFYGYANGQWQRINPIPKAYSRWDNFRILQESMEKNLNSMMRDLARSPALEPGSIEQKIGDFYASGMNVSALNKQGYDALKPLLTQIDSVTTMDALQALVPQLQQMGVNVWFAFGSQQDFKDSQSMIAVAMQGGLGLPDRDYYCSDDPKMQQIRTAYQQHIADVFQLMGETVAESKAYAVNIMRIETALAKASLTQVEQRDPYAIYHKMSLAALPELTPHFAWQSYFKALKLATNQDINVGMPVFFKAWDALLVTTALEDWKVYFRWHLMDTFLPYLSDNFVQEDFNFNKVLTGVEVLRPRWQRVVDTVNSALDMAVGKYYVEHYFSMTSKQSVQAIMTNIRHAFSQVIQNQPWMATATKQAALEKLNKMTERAGYPDKWRDYAALKIDRSSYVLNVMRANVFASQYELAKIGKPVDRAEWSMSPQTINAYYDPSMNSINILAGILQPPFFDASAPAAVNYGAIGFVIGHEMTHGFDSQGALFDGYGNLNNWWTPQDLQQFKSATACIAKQFSNYKVCDGLAVKGDLVVGEAAADLGGVLLAYQAFHASKDYPNAKIIDGFTPDQQFFLSVAHVWAGNIRPELAAQLVTVDPHPPAQYRVNGTLANMTAFQHAFSVKQPSPMIQDPRCQIW